MAVMTCLCAGVLLWAEMNGEHNYKKAVVQAKLDAYSDLIAAADSVPQIRHLLPPDLRITLLDRSGTVLFDTYSQTLSSQSHSDRPEVHDCLLRKEGFAIRFSETTEGEYLYFAKLYDNMIVRVALPYEVELAHYFRPDWKQLLVIIVFFAVMFAAVLLYSYRYEQKMRKVSEEKTRELKHQMTGNIAHELKTPVSSIRGYLETLVENPDLDDDNRKLFIERSYVQSLRLSELINDVALITKMEEAPSQFLKEPVNLKKMSDIVFEEFRAKLDQAHILIYNQLAEQLVVSGNPNLIYAIFRNLVENSLKYAGPDCEIHLEGKRTEKNTAIVYYDTGKGVPEEQLKHIFDRFYRVQGRHGEGSGLGLSIVRNAVLFHGGTISAYNHKPKGLRFEITL